MGSFGETVSWEIAPVCSTYPPEIAVGFVWENGAPTELASFGESPPRGVSLYFGTQHIGTGQWVRLGSRFGGDLTCFLDPSSRDHRWLRLGERCADRIGFVWENGAPTELASFGETVSWEIAPVCSTHPPEIAVGFVWENGGLASFGERSPSGSAEGDLSGTNCQRTVETKIHLHHRRMGSMMFGMRRESDNRAWRPPGSDWQVCFILHSLQPRGLTLLHDARAFVYDKEVIQLAIILEDRIGGAAPWTTSLASAV
jgi:hypothetical protein